MNGSKRDSSAPLDRMDIWTFSNDVSDRLLIWNIVNIAFGLILGRRGGFLRGFASQNIGWGVINAVIAVIGRRLMQKRRIALDDLHDSQVQQVESRKIRLILAVNGLLDVLYVLAGRRLARSGRILSMQHGIGLGVMIQGVLLFLFDWRMFRRSFWVRPA